MTENEICKSYNWIFGSIKFKIHLYIYIYFYKLVIMVSTLVDWFTSVSQIKITSIEAEIDIKKVLLIGFKKDLIKHYNCNSLY